MKSDNWHRTHVRSRHAHRQPRWEPAANAASIIVLLFILAVVLPLLWGGK
jgi:hypothetical protein